MNNNGIGNEPLVFHFTETIEVGPWGILDPKLRSFLDPRGLKTEETISLIVKLNDIGLQTIRNGGELFIGSKKLNGSGNICTVHNLTKDDFTSIFDITYEVLGTEGNVTKERATLNVKVNWINRLESCPRVYQIE